MSTNENNPNAETYTVKSGDSISKIAKELGLSDWKKFAEHNGLEEPYIIHPNQELKIPRPPENSKPYTIQKGDTLSQLAVEFNIKGGFTALAHKNSINDPSTIFAGQTIYIPEQEQKQNTAQSNDTSNTTELKPGGSLVKELKISPAHTGDQAQKNNALINISIMVMDR